jgi:hypothetical protein
MGVRAETTDCGGALLCPRIADPHRIAPDYVSENDVPHVWESTYLCAAAMLALGSR